MWNLDKTQSQEGHAISTLQTLNTVVFQSEYQNRGSCCTMLFIPNRLRGSCSETPYDQDQTSDHR